MGINPWVYDFAAFNLWSRPAGLLACLAMLREAGAEVGLLDCLDRTWEGMDWPPPGRFGAGHLPKRFLPRPGPLAGVPRRYGRYGLGLNEVRVALAGLDPSPDAFLVTCPMTYRYPGAVVAMRMCRELHPRVPVVLGGTWATLCPEHARGMGLADLVLSGPLELPDNWAALWRLFRVDPPPVPEEAGLALAQDLYPAPDYAVLLGSRGCPFDCRYCASRVLHPGQRRRRPAALLAEAADLARRGVRDLAFLDDALLTDRGWIEDVLTGLTGLSGPSGTNGTSGLGVRLHTPNALHIRCLDPDLCRLLRAAGLTTVRIGLESADFETRHDAKVTAGEWRRGAAALLEAGFDPASIGVYILHGLPDEDPASVRRAVAEVRSLGLRPYFSHYSPIPGSAMFEHACRVSPWPLRDEPLCQNNSIWPCVPGGYDPAAARRWQEVLNGNE